MNALIWIWGVVISLVALILIRYVCALWDLTKKQDKINKGITQWLVELDVWVAAGPPRGGEWGFDDFFGEDEIKEERDE